MIEKLLALFIGSMLIVGFILIIHLGLYMSKKCMKCQIEHPSTLEYFYKSTKTKDGLGSWCKICLKQRKHDPVYAKKWNNLNPDYHKEWRKKNPNKSRKYQLKHNFGITLEEYNELLKKQNYKCGICKRHQNEFSIRLAVDHNHETGEIRGLLCVSCNNGLGYFKDGDISLLDNAIIYIKKYDK